MTANALRGTQLFLLEFNELCPTLLHEFMEAGELPNFRRMHDSSAVYITDAEEPPPQLEPWIQWPTIHSGLTFEEHGAFHLGDGRKIKSRCLAALLSDAGIRVGVFCSMNNNYADLNGFYIPDPWDGDGVPHPAWLMPFFATVSQQVQDSSSAEGLSKGQLIRFGTFMLRKGLRWRTVKNILAQLVGERRDPGIKWRRASLLEEIQYDLFLYLNRAIRPQFATFFCNSTAHYQHYYWRNMHPEIFTAPPDANDHPSLQTAILYGYQRMDRLVGQFMADFPRATLILCTALSQQPWAETTKCTYRPVDFKGLFTFAGVNPDSVAVKPVMAEEFHLAFGDRGRALAAKDKLAGLTLDEKPLLKLEENGSDLFCGCAINDPLAMQRSVARADGHTRAFRDLFHMVHSMRSGRHHPDGVLWVRDGRHRVSGDKVRLVDIAPTILQRFNVRRPEYMKGSSLDRGDVATAAAVTV